MDLSRLRLTLGLALAALAVPALVWLDPAGAAAPSPAASGLAPSVDHRRTDTVALSGDVKRRQRLTKADLAAFPQQTVTATFSARGVPTTRTWTGPLLLDVVTAAQPRLDPAVSNDQLAFAIRVGATDGYRAVVAYGEIDPGFAGTPVLLALTEDGVALQRPRLVVPGDARGGRYVTDVNSVRVVDLGR